MLWVGFLYCFKSVHGEVTPQRPHFAAPQGYLRRKRARARLVGEDPYHFHGTLCETPEAFSNLLRLSRYQRKLRIRASLLENFGA